MTQAFIDQNYLIIENNVVTNIVFWNGDTSQWTPPQGSIALVQATTPAMIWVWNGTEWALTAVNGESDIGFTWDGTSTVTTAQKPTNPPPQQTI